MGKSFLFSREVKVQVESNFVYTLVRDESIIQNGSQTTLNHFIK